MSENKRVIVKTKLENPPEELVYAWGEPYQVFPVERDGTVEGLTTDHPRWVVLEREWKLEVEEVDIEGHEKDKAPDVGKEVT